MKYQSSKSPFAMRDNSVYSKYKNETQIRKWGKWCGIYVVLLLLLLLLLLVLLLLLLFKRKINLERNFVFVVK